MREGIPRISTLLPQSHIYLSPAIAYSFICQAFLHTESFILIVDLITLSSILETNSSYLLHVCSAPAHSQKYRSEEER